MRKPSPAALRALGWIAGIFALDRLTKVLAVHYLPFGIPHKVLLFFNLTYVENSGAAFGMLQNNNLLFTLVTLGLIAFMLYCRREITGYGKIAKLGFLFVLGGAVGNLYDRLFIGRVIDFLDLTVWPVFNVADSFITIGGCILAWTMIMPSGKKKENGKENA